jgi:uncharacterized protein YbjT (DUF2867 family)
MPKLTVLITGATGQQGGALARALLQRGHRIRAFVRNPESDKARQLGRLGAELVKGDFDDPASLRKAAAGVEAVFAMGTPRQAGPKEETRQGIAIVDAAKEAKVRHLLYSSVSDADRDTGVPHFDSKYEVERHIRSVDVPYTIVAPVYFYENFLSPFTLPGLKEGRLTMSLPAERKLQAIALANIASFDAQVLERRDAFLGRRINIASDELSISDYAAIISEASGRQINYGRTPLEQVRQFSEDLAAMQSWFDRVGYSADIEGLRRDFPKVGWIRFRDWAAEQDWGPLKS